MEFSVIMWGVGKVVIIGLLVGAPIRVLVIVMKKALTYKEEAAKLYVTKEAHTLLCHSANLEMQVHVTKVIGEAKKEIIEAIKNNGGV